MSYEDENPKPTASKVEDDKGLDEKDLKRSYLFGSSDVADATKPGMEGEGAGGHSFNKSSVTTSGDDPANPSRNAGYDNDYFKRSEPSEEHPENSNFKPGDQQTQPSNNNQTQEGTADYDGATVQGGQGRREPTNENATSDVADTANNVQHKIGEEGQAEPGKVNYSSDIESNSNYDDDDIKDDKGHIET